MDNDTKWLREHYGRLMELMERKMKEFDEKERRFAELKKLMSENAEKAKDRIKLNIGGKRFETTKSTLLQEKFGETFFSAMFNTGVWNPDEEGCYFVDRNPKNFERLLDYFRTGDLIIAELSPLDIEKLQRDLDFYQIKHLIPAPLDASIPLRQKWDTKLCSSKVSISEDGLTATKVEGKGYASVLASIPSTNFKVQYVSTGSRNWATIGFASKPEFNPNPSHHQLRLNGYYLHASNGSLYSVEDNTEAKEYTTQLKEGDIVEAIWNTEKNEISFSVNGKELPVAFINVKKDLFPALDLYCQGTSFKILN